VSVRRLLVECVKDHDWSVAPAALPELMKNGIPARLVPSAMAHRVTGCAYRSLSNLARPDDEALRPLEEGYRRSAASHLRALADVRAAGSVLDGAGVPWLVVKGPVLAGAYYPDPGLRTYFDVDLVVEARHFRRAIDALEDGGCAVVEHEWASSRRSLSVEVELSLPYGTPGDLHWHLLNDPVLRRQVNLPMADIFERARWMDLGMGLRVRTLDPEDTVIHLALHAVVSGGNRLVWVKDIEQAVLAGSQDGSLDWSTLIDRSRSTGAGLPVGTMLAQTSRILGTPVPDQVLRHLSAGRAWSRVAQVAERVSGFDAPSTYAPNYVVVRSSRRHLLSSLSQVAHHAVRGGFRVVSRKARGLFSGRSSEEGIRPVAGDVRRSAYCDAVERVAAELAS
jgi:Uncharacterised nucleotidyltransferase